MSVKTGQPGPHPQPTSYGRTDAGVFSVVPFEDVDAGRINQLAAVYDAQGYNYTVEHGFAKSKLTVQLSYNYQQQGAEVPVDVWEYQSQTAQKDLFAAAVFTGITARLSDQNRTLIKQAVAKTGPFEDPDGDDVVIYQDFAGTQLEKQEAFKLYLLTSAGVTDAIVQTPTIRHTQVVSQVYPITISKTNIGRIYSTATLISENNPPQWAVTGLPTDTDPAFASGIALSYGWLKCGPAIQNIAYRKTQIIQEFQWGLWATAIYGSVL